MPEIGSRLILEQRVGLSSGSNRMGWGWGVLTNLLAKILTLGNPSFPCLKCSLYLQIHKRTTSWAPLKTTQHSPLSSNNTHQMLTFAPTFFSGAQEVRQTHGTTLGQWHKPVTCVTSRRTVLWTLFASTQQLRSVIQKSLVVQVQGSRPLPLHPRQDVQCAEVSGEASFIKPCSRIESLDLKVCFELE